MSRPIAANGCGWLGARVRAASIRSDYADVLAGRETELLLARQLGDPDALDAAESSIVSTLGHLGRADEAAALGHALLARVDADGSGLDAKLPWVLDGLLGAAEHRHRDAALLLGHARQAFSSRGMLFEPAEEERLARVLAAAGGSLGMEQAQMLVQQGRSLSDDAAHKHWPPAARPERSSQRPLQHQLQAQAQRGRELGDGATVVARARRRPQSAPKPSQNRRRPTLRQPPASPRHGRVDLQERPR